MESYFDQHQQHMKCGFSLKLGINDIARELCPQSVILFGLEQHGDYHSSFSPEYNTEIVPHNLTWELRKQIHSLIKLHLNGSPESSAFRENSFINSMAIPSDKETPSQNDARKSTSDISHVL